MNYYSVIKEAKSDGIMIGIYGLGLIFHKAADDMLRYFDIEPDFYSDIDKEKLSKFDARGKRKISFEELLKEEKKTIIIVTVGCNLDRSVKESFSNNSNLILISFKDMCLSDEYIMSFFGLQEPLTHYKRRDKIEAPKRRAYERQKIAVFTCITGGYDSIAPVLCKEDCCDYYFITDTPQEASDYRLINVDDILPSHDMTNKEKNKYCKMHGYRIFNDYSYSIYFDGNLQIVGRASSLISELGDYGLGFHMHPWTDDCYSEALQLSVLERIKRNEAQNAVNFYIMNGLPRNYGAVETGVIVSDHHNDKAIMILDQWYSNFMRGEAKRDQLYLPYTLFKLGIDVEEVASFKSNQRSDGITKELRMHRGYQR